MIPLFDFQVSWYSLIMNETVHPVQYSSSILLIQRHLGVLGR